MTSYELQYDFIENITICKTHDVVKIPYQNLAA